MNFDSPASARSLTTLKNPDDVKCLLFGKSIDRDGTGWTEADDCNALGGLPFFRHLRKLAAVVLGGRMVGVLSTKTLNDCFPGVL